MLHLSEIADIQAGLTVRSAKDGVGVSVLTMASLSGVHASGCEASCLLLAEDDESMRDEKYHVHPLDILIPTRTTPDYLKPVILEENFHPPYVFSSSLLRIRLRQTDIHPWWLLGYLRSPMGMKQILQGSQSTTGQLNLNAKTLMRIKIPTQTSAEQFRIGELIRASHIAHRSAKDAADRRLQLAQAIAFQHNPSTDH